MQNRPYAIARANEMSLNRGGHVFLAVVFDKFITIVWSGIEPWDFYCRLGSYNC